MVKCFLQNFEISKEVTQTKLIFFVLKLNVREYLPRTSPSDFQLRFVYSKPPGKKQKFTEVCGYTLEVSTLHSVRTCHRWEPKIRNCQSNLWITIAAWTERSATDGRRSTVAVGLSSEDGCADGVRGVDSTGITAGPSASPGGCGAAAVVVDVSIVVFNTVTSCSGWIFFSFMGVRRVSCGAGIGCSGTSALIFCSPWIPASRDLSEVCWSVAALCCGLDPTNTHTCKWGYCPLQTYNK